MTTYTTRTLAEKLIGDDTKQATRTLRKFLRDDLGEGKAVVGKGGRYALELKAVELRAMGKRFAAWETAQEEAKIARAAEMKAKAEAPITDEADTEAASPTDEEIAAMLSDDDEADIEDESDDEVDEG